MGTGIQSFVLQGVDARPCEVEADLRPSELSGIAVVGLPDAAVREAVDRVRTALHRGGWEIPPRRITVNLAPGNVRKEGPVYDLPIAMAILGAAGCLSSSRFDGAASGHVLVAGELALDGRVRPIRGAIAMADLARRRGGSTPVEAGDASEPPTVLVPRANAAEAAVVDGVRVLPADSLAQVARWMAGEAEIAAHPPIDAASLVARAEAAVDFADVRGQEAAKRAAVVAAAGGHNLLLVGPPGTGKTMIARALPGILPPLTTDEALEVTRIHSAAGVLEPGAPLVVHRPVRAPHHTASSAAVVGGGTDPRPGDVTLAHRGVLFLDEMPEFGRGVLDTLRQPLEEGVVTIARARGSVRFPARFMLVGALNPSRRGGRRDPEDPRAVDRYLARLSGPLLDRIDLQVEVDHVDHETLSAGRSTVDSRTLREQVAAARRVAAARGQAAANAHLAGADLDAAVRLDDDARTLLADAMRDLGLSARGWDRVRRVARTIADVSGAADVGVDHVAEALQYRLLDRLVSA